MPHLPATTTAGAWKRCLNRLWSRLRIADTWQRSAVAIWTAVLVIICIRSFVSPRTNSVYPIFANAARAWRAGADLYRPVSDPYRYSPFVTVLFVPSSLLPDAVGGVLWRLLNASLYLTALAYWARRVLPHPVPSDQLAYLLLLVLPLSIGSLNNGQSNALILGLLLTAVTAVAAQRWNLASGCAALATLFKIYPIAVGLLLVVVYPRRLAGRFAIALLIGVALPFFLHEPGYVLREYVGWFQQVISDDRQNLPPEFWYRDLRLLCQVCHVPISSIAYLIIQLLTAGGIAAICLAAAFRRWESHRLLTLLLGLAGCWMTLFGSAAESCTYILLAPTLAWCLLKSWREHYPLGVRIGLLLSYGMFTLAQTAVWFPWGRSFHTIAPQPLAALLLLLSLLFMELPALFAQSASNGQVAESIAA